ncbi:hypothetical protein KR038_010140 [Drosophila bunnanda]|nr:hypothetical protein KR038_010140 [Drosophila bunnanda]
MVVCTATMPMETRHQSQQMKEPPGQIDGSTNAVPGGQGQGGVEEDDREEGEIVDDFEMIISSEDEEFKLRARIQQLEENNKDVERMDMLSANLANQYNYSKPVGRSFRYQHKPTIYVLSDVSSQSDDEFQEQRKHRRHKIRRLDLSDKRHHRTSNGGDYRRNPLSKRIKHKQVSPSPPPLHRYHHQRHLHQQHHHQEGILLASLDSATDDECDVNIDDEDDELADLQRLKLSRHKLRVALALEERQEELGQYKNSLKERLQYRLRKSPSPKFRKEYSRARELQLLSPLQALCDAEEDEPEPNHQDSQQQETLTEDPVELRLRLIALKSAILKKHLARKKRDAERAYSPTDMIQRVHPAISNEDDIDDLMEISPAASPDRIPSPPRYSIDDAVDTKPVDMDLAETDSDDQHNAWDSWAHNWNSMDNAGGSWRCFIPNSLPPVSMPIVIDEENEEGDTKAELCESRAVEVFTDDDVPPPPPPFHIPQMHLEDEDARDAMHLVDDHSNHSSFTDMQSVTMDSSQTRSKSLDKYQPDSSDDEAGALRAMLLSNLRPNKPPAPPPPAEPPFPPVIHSVPVPVPAPVHPPAAKVNEESDSDSDSDDPEELRSLLLSSIATKKRINHTHSRSATSPLILKNAVRRFQPIKNEESLEDQQSVEEQYIIEPKADENNFTDPSPGDEELSQDQQPVEEDLTEPYVDKTIAETSNREADSPISMDAVETAQPPLVAIQPSIQATKHTSPSTKIIKIVKPNKVINKLTTTKRKLPLDDQSVSSLSIKRPSTLMIKEPSSPLHRKNGITSSTRLITTVDPASIKVNKLVISLAEESAASDDDLELGSFFAYASYADIASPLSLPMGGSPSVSTTRSNTPISEIVETAPSDNGNIRRTLINEYFEKKIDDFLRQARSNAPANGNLTEATTEAPTTEAPAPEKVPENAKVNGKVQTAVTTPKMKPQPKITPVVSRGFRKTLTISHLIVQAVRHLPVASQKEYLRLVERMRLLEKKKNLTAKTAPPPVPARKAPAVEKPLPLKNGFHQPAKATTTVAPSPTSSKTTVTPEKPQAKPPQTKASSPKTKLNQPPKESRLIAFENSFAKIGCSMITNLDKSLQMVEEAKKSKVIRLRCSQRLKELYAEMQSVKLAAQQEELKLSRIQPEIQATHEIIISLKQKRHKLQAAAMDLGRGLRGDDYRLRDDGKVDISRKTKQLTKEIRLYNTIVKYDDLNKLTEVEEEAKTVIENAGDKEEQRTEIQEVPSPSETAAPDPVETEMEPQPEPEPTAVEIPDNPAQDDVIEAPKNDSPAPYTTTSMRELSEEKMEPELRPSRSYYLPAYQTPMPRNYNSHLDVHATICPFDLMGRCEDTDCSYLHLARPDAPSELPKTTNLSPIH